MSLKKRDTPEAAAFWDFVERTAAEWCEQEPEWSRKQRGEKIGEALGLSGNIQCGVDGGVVGDAPEQSKPSKPKGQVSIETLEQLIAKWRKDTVQLLPPGVKYDGRRARLACADDLEAITRQETK